VGEDVKKTKKKLDETWEAHNVDSHVLCELATGVEIAPFKGMYVFKQLKWHRRQLHVQNYTKGHVRKQYGTTRSLGFTRGTLTRHEKYGKIYIGGSSKGKLSFHCATTGKRLTQNGNPSEVNPLAILRWRTFFLPSLKEGVSKGEN
jgi:hypothetical protein